MDKKIPWNLYNSRGILWQPEKDSNPHKQSQSLSCYPYTIRLSTPLSQGRIYPSRRKKRKRVVWSYRSPAFRVAEGNPGWLGVSGKCWVSRQKPWRKP